MGTDGRGLDHLMEQNEAELGFLSAYGGVDGGSQTDGASLLSALHRFLKAGGMPSTLEGARLSFEAGHAEAEEHGCRFSFKGSHLPLVASDMKTSGFAEGELSEDRSEVNVVFTAWSMDQRRFVERLVEHHVHG
jgi:hypothetical protein|tara:strand:- start:128 stop:529 length:402 start_codon:yes stop_codon:yes gene_type:complete